MTIIYQSDVENNANKGTKIYVDIVETSFKAQFKNHNKDFNHEQHKRTHKNVKIFIVVKKCLESDSPLLEKYRAEQKLIFVHFPKLKNYILLNTLMTTDH